MSQKGFSPIFLIAIIAFIIVIISFIFENQKKTLTQNPTSSPQQETSTSAFGVTTGSSITNTANNTPPLPTSSPVSSQAVTQLPGLNPSTDYSAEEIKVAGVIGNDITIHESADLIDIKVEAWFRSNIPTSSKALNATVYYDNKYKATLTGNDYNEGLVTFIYYLPLEPGTHTVRMVVNEKHAVTEVNYNNNQQSVTYTFVADSTPPTFSIDKPSLIDGQTCMRWINLSDNVFTGTDVWAKWKIDNEDWSDTTSDNPYGCISATPGTKHTYSVYAEDLRGNSIEKLQTFTAL